MHLVHEIHTSERKSFKGCRRRWDWHFRQNWTPIGMAPPLEFGIAYHKGMEVLYNPDTWDWDREVTGELAVKTFVDSCNKQKAQFLKDTGDTSLEPAKEDEYQERIELGRGMLRYFYSEQLTRYPESWKPVKVEIAFEVPIESDGIQLMCKCEQCWRRQCVADEIPYDSTSLQRQGWPGLPLVYAGRIDCIGEDLASLEYWIVDWKTARSISADDEFLELDDQVGSYVWACRKMLNLPVAGFYYHEQKKGYPKEPVENANVRLGCKYSKNKQQDTDYEHYLRTIKEHDTLAYQQGLYDDYLQFLKVDGIVFHKRWIIYKNEHQLEQIGYNIMLEALDMIDPNLRLYPNAGRFSCKFCAFRQPCLSQFRGEGHEYTLETLFKKEEPYYYRQARGASTESKGGE